MASKLEGQEALLRRLRAIGEPRPFLRVLQLEAIAEAKRLVPRKTGNLGKSIVAGSLTSDSAIVEARANYAAHVEFGTRPHVIRPKRGSVLAWPANASGRRLSGRARTKAGRMIIARKVDHPGTKAQPFLVPGAKAALRRGGFKDIVTKNWNEAA